MDSLKAYTANLTMLSADAVFSDIFTLNTVGVMTQELKSLFLVQRSNQSVCLSYNNAISFVVLITSLNLRNSNIVFLQLY